MSTGYLIRRDEYHRLVQHGNITEFVHVEMFIYISYRACCIKELHELYVGCFDEGV